MHHVSIKDESSNIQAVMQLLSDQKGLIALLIGGAAMRHCGDRVYPVAQTHLHRYTIK
jgi:hypothetical protein